MTRKAMLVILDGFGESDAKDHNAIHLANTPTWDALKQSGDLVSIDASGQSVGLPAGQMGNSEVGHMHIGAGRIIEQEFARISNAIQDGSWVNNETLQQAFKQAESLQSTVHIMGLLSPGGVHSHEDHIFSMIELARTHTSQPITIHAFLDGRDTPPQSAEGSLNTLMAVARKHQAHVSTIAGRYYAMDRDQRWERIEQSYQLLTEGTSPFTATDPIDALQQAYARGEHDEFVQPTKVEGAQTIQPNDIVLFMNFRADRARELCTALTAESFDGFNRSSTPQIHLYTLTQYQEDLNAQVIFKPQQFSNTLGEVVAQAGLSQLRIAETEKYAHVTFFLNGGREAPFSKEDRILVPSPKVATYDLQPEMSAEAVTDHICDAIADERYDLIVVNYANADMVGHTGKLDAAITAIETLDACLARLADSAKQQDVELLITADHGNAECMYNQDTEQAHTAHTQNLVPCLHVGRAGSIQKFTGSLIDVAPTILELMGLEIPAEMQGQPLVKLQ